MAHHDQRQELGLYITRDAILKLLSNDEVAKVSNSETVPNLIEGEEYVDLGQIALGVRKAQGKNTPAKNVLLKKSVHKETWNKIVEQLAAK